MKEKISGIYKISNTINSKYYIGSSINIKRRWSRHKNDLKNNKHKNILLQNYYNKYGDIFIFEIVEVVYAVDINLLHKREQYYLDTLNPFNEVGFNINRYANGGFSISNNPNKQEIINKISSKMKQVWLSKTDDEKYNQTKLFSSSNNPSKKGIYLGNQNKHIIIDDIEYISLTDAENKLNIKKGTIHYRINSKSFQNYNYK